MISYSGIELDPPGMNMNQPWSMPHSAIPPGECPQTHNMYSKEGQKRTEWVNYRVP